MAFGDKWKKFWRGRKAKGFPVLRALPELIRVITDVVKAAKK